MNHETLKQAARIYKRLVTPVIQRYSEGSYYGSLYDCGEWSDAASASAEENALNEIAERVSSLTGYSADEIREQFEINEHFYDPMYQAWLAQQEKKAA